MASPSSPAQSGDDHTRRTFKRDRETDPATQQPTTPSEAIPTKKNRLEQDSHPAAAADSMVAFSPDKPHTSNAQAVRQISQKVQDISWEEQQKRTGVPSPAEVPEDEPAAKDSSAAQAKSSTSSSTQLSFGAFSSRSNPFGSARTSSNSSIFGAANSQGEASSSISSAASSSNAAGSWLDSSQSQSSSVGGANFRPAANAHNMGSANARLPFLSQESGMSQSQSGAMSPAAASSGLSAPESSQESGVSSSQQSFTLGDKTPTGPPADTSSPRKQAFGFGSFAKGSAFSKKVAGASPLSGPSTAAAGKSIFEAESSDTLGSSSDTANPSPALASAEAADSHITPPAGEARAGGQSNQAFQRRADEDSTLAAATDRTTGEEEERTIFSARGRLFEMDTATQNWKERGTGTIKCNVPNEVSGGLFGAGRGASGPGAGKRRSPARLVMRTDGVLRLILNVVLFTGMSVELAQEKFVRFSAFEEGKLVHFTVRVPQPKIAEELFDTIQSRIPAAPASAEGRNTAEDGKTAEGSSKDEQA
ncbi:hypothetical protein OC842_006109 [Tilletia horrida]|uniref:RanBD1 domain-containing protein n=1 Tax=Tilletia horrida TaxID=155126 RepID=A0AAN6G6I7_9BASI|nr:hypothetical protein OC842_006109 [Tilletia horrida]